MPITARQPLLFPAAAINSAGIFAAKRWLVGSAHDCYARGGHIELGGRSKMNAFEFYIGFLGLLLGLSIAELLSKTADAIHARKYVPIGWLCPLLAASIVLGITATWCSMWGLQEHVVISWPLLFITAFLSSGCYIGAALVFPRNARNFQTLDEHYWETKRWVIGIHLGVALLLSSYISYVTGQSIGTASLEDWVSSLRLYLPLVILLFSRHFWVDCSALTLLVTSYLPIEIHLT